MHAEALGRPRNMSLLCDRGEAAEMAKRQSHTRFHMGFADCIRYHCKRANGIRPLSRMRWTTSHVASVPDLGGYHETVARCWPSTSSRRRSAAGGRQDVSGLRRLLRRDGGARVQTWRNGSARSAFRRRPPRRSSKARGGPRSAWHRCARRRRRRDVLGGTQGGAGPSDRLHSCAGPHRGWHDRQYATPRGQVDGMHEFRSRADRRAEFASSRG